MSKDDTLPLQHHCSLFRGRSFRTTPILSRKCSNSTRGRVFVSTSSNHHHLHLQYVNTELSPSISPICEYWKHHHRYRQYRNTESIIISIFSIEIRNHHHLHLQYVNTETSSISSVWEYWNIIICIFILYVEISDFYVLQRNTRFSVITTLVIT